MIRAVESKKRGVDKQRQLEMLYVKALSCRVHSGHVSGLYEVISTSGAIYDVYLDENTRQCNCRNGIRRLVATCSHVMAASITRMQEKGYEVVGVACNDYLYDKAFVDAVARINSYTRLLLRRNK